MIKIKNGVVELSKTRVLTPKQQARLNQLKNQNLKNIYLSSLIGLTKTSVFVPTLKSYGHDLLGLKGRGTILSKLRRMRNTSHNTNHIPDERNLGSWIGVEIECLIPHENFNGRATVVECECETDENGYVTNECEVCENGDATGGQVWSRMAAHQWLRRQIEAAKISRVSVKNDGSVSDDNDDDSAHGAEVTILFDASKGYEELAKLCAVLKKAGCYVNKTCGLHVHLDARHLEVRQVKTIGRSLGNALPVLKWMVPESRHSNEYCELGVSGVRGSRYYAVNLTSFIKFKTIEVRIHSGTTVFDKIKNWIEILKAIGGARISSPVKQFQELMDKAELSDALVEYAERRIMELNPGAWPGLNPAPVETPRPQSAQAEYDIHLAEMLARIERTRLNREPA